MKNQPATEDPDKLDQLGSTDQIEQRAAELAVKNDRTRVSDKDRREAMEQMQETSPPAPQDSTQ